MIYDNSTTLQQYSILLISKLREFVFVETRGNCTDDPQQSWYIIKRNEMRTFPLITISTLLIRFHIQKVNI